MTVREAVMLTCLCVLAGIILFLLRYLPSRTWKRFSQERDDLTQRYYREVEDMYRQMRGWRHDYRNHIQVMNAYLSLGQTQALKEYLLTMDRDLSDVDTVIRSGNVMMDAVLNNKLHMAEQLHIRLNVKAAVPPKPTVNETDLCVIVGNLLDNAVEACTRVSEAERFLRIYIGTLKGQMYISVTNASKEQTRLKAGFTTKSGGSHGFGLMRIDGAVRKYDGSVNRQQEAGVFATEVLLPL